GYYLAGATVSIASGAGTGDTLSFTSQDGITGSFSSGKLSLTGTASAADYQSALDSVTFSTTSTSTTARTLDWTVSDGVVSSATTTSTVDVSSYGAPAKFEVSATTPVTAGGSSSVIVTAQDANGNTVLNDSDSVSITMTGSSTVLATVTLSSGTGMVNVLLTTVGTYTLTATDESHPSIGGISNPVTVNAITPTFTWSPASTIIFGSAGTNVLDASVNCVSCGSISYTETPTGGGSAVPITTTTGLAAGTYNITANFTPSSGDYNAISDTQQLTVSGESVWVVNSGGGTGELAGNGYAISPIAYGGANAAVAIDSSGNVWTVGTGATLLEDTSQTGIVENSISSGGGLDAPSAIAIDGNSQIWITNSGNNSISLFLDNGTAVSPSTGFTDSPLSTPSGIAVDLSGSIWIANKGNNTVTRILGAAAPAAPLSTAAANNTTGARP
ncbi:MAG: hypothetical protein WCC14_18350, partial [Acidobacteriaceae bacterium]